MSERIVAKAAGKINLGLNITGTRNGLHTLDSIMCSVSVYDRAVYTPSEDALEIRAQSSLDGFDRTLCEKSVAAVVRKFTDAYGECGGRLDIRKSVPFGAGMGGSTACAAAAIRALAECKNIALDNGFLLSLGSDMPFMYRGGCARVRGSGDEIEPVDAPKIYFVAAQADGSVSSKEAYALFDANFTPARESEEAMRAYSRAFSPDMPHPWLAGIAGNDLEGPAKMLNAHIAEVQNDFAEAGAPWCDVTGSGSAVYCAFYGKDNAYSLFDALSARRRGVLFLESVPQNVAVDVWFLH